jgi:hypothetical protein
MATKKKPPMQRRKGKGARGARLLAGQVKAAEALHLRIQGHSFHEIAAKLGYRGHQPAMIAVDRALAGISETARRDATKLREEMDARYLALLQRWWPRATAVEPDYQALSAVLDVLRDLRKLHNLDAKPVTGQGWGEDLDAVLAEWEPIAADPAAGGPAALPQLPGADWEAWEAVEPTESSEGEGLGLDDVSDVDAAELPFVGLDGRAKVGEG